MLYGDCHIYNFKVAGNGIEKILKTPGFLISATPSFDSQLVMLFTHSFQSYVVIFYPSVLTKFVA